MKWIKNNRYDSYLDLEQKSKKYIPPCNYYQRPTDWKSEMSSYFWGGSPNKGKFLKNKKVTVSEELQI